MRRFDFEPLYLIVILSIISAIYFFISSAINQGEEIKQARDEYYTIGYEAGYEEGYGDGYADGYADGLADK